MKDIAHSYSNNTISQNHRINFIQNAGVISAEVICEIYSENIKDISIDIAVIDSNGNEIIKKSKDLDSILNKNISSIRISLPSRSAKYIINSAIYSTKEDGVIFSKKSREIIAYSNYADTGNIRFSEKSLFEKSVNTGLRYIKSINVDKLLAPSYEVHELTPPNNAVRYGGWERKGASNWTDSSSESFTLAGHSLGHWMSAASVFYRQTGDMEILERLQYTIDKLYELQLISGSGYIGGCKEDTFIKCFAGDDNWHENYWVPWYGIHKIYQGLLDAYDYTDNVTAFSVLKHFTDWAVEGISGLSDEQMQNMLNIEHGGMNEILARMYEITGDKIYLKEAVRFTHKSVLDPLAGNEDNLTGMHANTQIPKIIGAAEIYEQDPVKYYSYRHAAENFWRFVNCNRSYAIGGNSISEHFEAKGAETLGIKTCESCNTYNMMRLTEHLFLWEHKPEYIDWYEKALYNHILSQQEPENGEKMYFVSLLQGHHRVYEIKDKSWWCCTGTGMENPGRYARTAYYEDGNDIYINLYFSGEYICKSHNIAFRTKTEYPYSDKIIIAVEHGSAYANLKLRAPSWLKREMIVSAHNKTYSSKGGEYLSISGTWIKGDILEITIPMDIRVYKSRSENQIVYEYGPIVLAAELGSVVNVPGVKEYISNETKIDSVTARVPHILASDNELTKIVSAKDKSKLLFKIDGSHISNGTDIVLKPFFEIHHSFYNVYWNIGSDGNNYEIRLNDITIDKVEPDGQQDELGHGIVEKNSNHGNFTIDTKNYIYRKAFGGTDSFFQYSMEIDPHNENYLFVRYCIYDALFKNNNPECLIDFCIYADNTLISTQTFRNSDYNKVIDVFYQIPLECTKGKKSINIKFSATHDNTYTGAVTEVRTTKAAYKNTYNYSTEK